MGIDALSALGVDDEEIVRVETDYRARDAQRLDAQISSGDLHALKEIYYRSGADG
jgi:glutathione-regulated potassium-efflux system protein KefB